MQRLEVNSAVRRQTVNVNGL